MLVTGGAGYIGSHAAKTLWMAGYQPIVFDDLSNGHREAVRWGPLIEGDVRNEYALAQAMAKHEVCGVIHFAGLIEVGSSFVSPDRFWDHNVNGVAAVLRAMRRTNVRRLVFSSTAAVYGQPRRGQITGLTEDHPTHPINPYGDTKLAAERMIAASCQAYGLTAIALRYFNAAGADGDGTIGEAHSPESHLIPLAIEAALASTPLTVNGADFVTADGSCVRDYVHVSDLAEAHVLALKASIGPTGFEALNLGTGRGFTVLAVLAAVERAAEASIARRHGARRIGDPAILIADASKAKALLGWRPVQSTLAEIVGSAVAWRRSKGFCPSPNLNSGIAISSAPFKTAIAHGPPALSG
ncbi:MAG: UDP-glucose 4-epimerase GalE [Alphaproteobacteria bacterium]|nr:MAG: UDP-glucose 4-epimerase GalE [Alphaproteobacteria bacterium]